MPPKIHQARANNEGKGENGNLSARETVLVCVRVRPLNRKERKSRQKIAWKLDGNQITQLALRQSQGLPPRSFTYDKLWGEDITNSDIFSKIGFSVVQTTMQGYHGVVFAYGQTSSGKTYSIHGSEDDPGMIPRAVQSIFEYIENTTDRDFVIQVSYMEIYNEVIKDLLNPTGASLNVREDKKKGIYVDKLAKETVMSTENIYALLAQGESHRHIGKTDYNAVSSRSHTIFQIMIESQSSSPHDKVVLESKLNLVDLAGSENTSKAGLDKKAETANINRSLLALASVIWKISEPKKKKVHVPYRDSKLTRVLQDSLGGKACITILCCLSPSDGNIDESLSTLKFASRAKDIKNTAKKNVKQADAKTLIAKYKSEIDELRQKLLEAGKTRPNQIAPDISPAMVSPTKLEEQMRKSEEEKQELLNKIDHLNKIILKSPFRANFSSDEILHGTAKPAGPNCRRPSYFNMGSRLGATTVPSVPRRRQSAFCASFNKLTIPENSMDAQTGEKKKRLIRQRSLGLCDETGNEEIDDLLCLPAEVHVHFEKEKTKEKAVENAQLRAIINEKEQVILQLEEDIEDQRQEMKTQHYENETYLQTIREYEEKLSEYEEKEQAALSVNAAPEKKKSIQVEKVKSFKLISSLRSDRSWSGSSSGPLIGFFMKNETTGMFEYEGRTEWIKGTADNHVFARGFVVKNIPELEMRFSVYDVNNESEINQGDFMGSVTIELRDLVKQVEDGANEFVEFKLDTDNEDEQAWLRVKLAANTTSKHHKKKKKKINMNS